MLLVLATEQLLIPVDLSVLKKLKYIFLCIKKIFFLIVYVFFLALIKITKQPRIFDKNGEDIHAVIFCKLSAVGCWISYNVIQIRPYLIINR